jgi:hypothetical protein
MTSATKGRHKKSKTKKAAKGKKSVSVMLEAGTKDLIDQERKRSGETIASVIERAVSALLSPATAEQTHEDKPVASSEKLDFIKKHPNGPRIYEVVGMYHNSGANAKKIALALNYGKFKTFSGNKEWTEEDVKEILDVVENDLLLYSKIIENLG